MKVKITITLIYDGTEKDHNWEYNYSEENIDWQEIEDWIEQQVDWITS